MKYKGIELKEFTSDKTVVFDPPKEMLVWDYESSAEPSRAKVYAYLPNRDYPFQTAARYNFKHGAELLNPRRATNLELMKWLAQGNGWCTNKLSTEVWAFHEFDVVDADKPCNEYFHIRKWEDKEWHEPTADYMGLEG